jgi:hypothetical protein
MEVGGVLLGSIGPGRSVHVESFEAIPCEHRLGPSFILSEADLAGLGAMLRRFRQVGIRVVGYYRSSTGREPALDENDKALLAEHFDSDVPVVLLIKPISLQQCEADFIVRDHLHHTEPIAAPAAEIDEGLSRGTYPMAMAREEMPPPLPRLRAGARNEYTGSTARPALWLWVALGLTTVTGSVAAHQWWKLSREPQSTALGLNVQPVGGFLEATWDPAAPGIRQATRGALLISDGNVQNKVELNGAALGRGKFSYVPSSQSVSFRLITYGQGAPSTDSMRIVTNLQAGPAAARPATEPERTAPAPAILSGEVVTPAKAVAEVQPSLPPGIRSRIRQKIVLPVEVEISRTGRVISAVAPAQPDGLYRYLARRAVSAAKAWRFRPARGSNGTAVPATTTLYFSFGG